MDWVKLLTDFDGDPKVLSVGLAGAGLYARSLAYAGEYETDGDIPEAWVNQVLASDLALAKALVKQGLWQKTDEGYHIVGFTEVNRSHEEMERLRKNRKRAGKRGGKAKAVASAKANAKQTNSYSISNSKSVSSKGKKKKSKPDVFPENGDPRLIASAEACLPILQRAAEARGANLVTRPAVYRAVESYPLKAHAQVAGQVEHWTVHGNGATKPAKDIVSRFRNFLDGAPDVAATQPKFGSGPVDYEASRRKHLESKGVAA